MTSSMTAREEWENAKATRIVVNSNLADAALAEAEENFNLLQRKLWEERKLHAENEEKLAQAEATLEKLKAAEVSANRQDFWGNEGDADAIRRHAIREALGLGLKDEVEQTWNLTDRLTEAEERVRELEEFVAFVRRTAGDQWTDNVLTITAARLTAPEPKEEK